MTPKPKEKSNNKLFEIVDLVDPSMFKTFRKEVVAPFYLKEFLIFKDEDELMWLLSGMLRDGRHTKKKKKDIIKPMAIILFFADGTGDAQNRLEKVTKQWLKTQLKKDIKGV